MKPIQPTTAVCSRRAASCGLCLLWTAWLLAGFRTAGADEFTAKMRVGLSRFATAAELTLRAEPGAHLLDAEGRERAAGGGPFVLTREGKTVTARDSRSRVLGSVAEGAFWRLQSDEATTVLTLTTPNRAAYRYRGGLEIGVSGGRLRVINEVGLEDYVRGVIGPEMGSRAPLEALKAQAVAARTFALSSLGHWTSDGYDLRDSTDSQVYSGVEAERPECDRAVRETAGLILTVGGHPISAFFCADCGGVTAPGSSPDECPRSVSDSDAHGLTSRPAPPAWTLTYPPQKLTALLGRSAPAGLELMGVTVAETDTSGRVRRLRLTWVPTRTPKHPKGKESGEGYEEKPPDDVPPIPEPPYVIRKKEPPLPPGAVLRDLPANTLRTLLGADTLRSTLFTVRRSAPEGAFVFEGRGWGHGRGLCQVGAMAMAAPPYAWDFRAILHRYYAGAALTPLASTQENEEGGSETPAAPASRPDLPSRAARGRHDRHP